ncbi:hypothetical protein ACFWVC_25470 [Streptomyces sp. NPDC058691]|uniref:hypothetical protein n=1 Tax=Streptomyces sp. NPDC058691 TaxID=3346601 RepID=UPI00365DC7F7
MYDLAFGAALLSVALDVGNTAWRLHRWAANRPRLGAVLTPVVLRVAAAVLGVTGMTIGAVRLGLAFNG